MRNIPLTLLMLSVSGTALAQAAPQDRRLVEISGKVDQARLKRDIECGRIDAVLFFSPSAVDAYMALVGPVSNVVIGALGRTTAERATRYGLPVHVQPGRHTIRDLGEALREYVQAEGRTPGETQQTKVGE